MVFFRNTARAFGISTGIILLLGSFLSAANISNPSKTVFQKIDRFILNYVTQPLVARSVNNSNIAIVGIGDNDLARYGAWPWSREQLATLIAKISAAKPEVIALPFFIDPNREDGNIKNLFVSISNAENVVFSIKFDPRNEENFTSLAENTALDKARITDIEAEKDQYGSNTYLVANAPFQLQTPVKQIAEAGKTAGVVNYPYDEENNLHSLLVQYSGYYYKTFPSAVAEAFLLKKNRSGFSMLKNQSGIFSGLMLDRTRLPVSSDGSLRLSPYASSESEESVVFPFRDATSILNGNFKKEDLQGKIAIIDVTAKGYAPRTLLGKKRVPRAVLQATAIQNLIDHSYIKSSRTGIVFSWLFLFAGLLLGLWSAFHKSFISAFLSGVFICPVILVGAAALLLSSTGEWVFVSYGILGSVLSFSSHFSAKYFSEDRQRRMIEKALTGYTSQNVIENLLAEGETFLNRKGEYRDVTVLFFDIKGFTQLASRLTADECFEFLNYVFRLTDGVIINDHHGLIDKKVGDGCMALFGLNGNADHPIRAIRAALDIQELFFEKFDEIAKRAHHNSMGPGAIQVRIGISTGGACIGNLGSGEHFNFTAVGENVNMAQRLEAACKPGQVLISDETYRRTKDLIEAHENNATGKREEEFYIAYQVMGINEKGKTINTEEFEVLNAHLNASTPDAKTANQDIKKEA